MPYRYVPMMKTKAGEVTALQNLSVSARTRILPLLHVCESVAPSFPPQIATAWQGYPIAVDGAFNFARSGSASTTVALIQALRAGGLATMPSIGVVDPAQYQQATRQVVDGNGAIVKASLGTLPTLASFAASLGLPTSSVDAIVDVKHIASVDLASYAGYVSSVLNQHAPALALFRTVTLAAAAAPKDHGSLQYGANHVPRTDWLLWSAVRAGLPFQLDYGDYLTGHPDLTEPPGAAMASATVSARYTLDNEWLIIKGRSTSGQYGLPMATQYRAHAAAITAYPGFGGINSWADSQIFQAAAGAPKMGSRQKWSGFAANRHLSLVADRLP